MKIPQIDDKCKIRESNIFRNALVKNVNLKEKFFDVLIIGLGYKMYNIPFDKFRFIKNEKTKIINIEMPFHFPGVDEYENGWNECLDQMKILNKSVEQVCLMNTKCSCNDCQSENVVMDR